MEANLIVTYDPQHRDAAKRETESLVNGKFLESKTPGVFLLATRENPKSVVKRLSQLLESEPFRFRYTFRYIPVEKWIDTNIDSIEKVLKELNSKISHSESWKMHIESRNFRVSKTDLIRKLTEHIERPKIDLKNPDKTIRIDIIGEKTAVSLLNRDEHLNASRSMS